MAEEENRIPSERPSPGEPAGDIDLPSDNVLDNIPPEQMRGFQSALDLVLGISVPASNPIHERISSEHITQSLNNRDNESRRSHERRENDAQRAHESENSHRRFTFGFGFLILSASVGLIVLFGIRESYEVVTAIIGGLLGFAGGFGVGRMRR